MNTRLVDYPNGAKVPADEPAVAAARAAHLNARAGASAYAPAAASGYGYSGPLNMNTRLVGYPNGAKVPADEPAVAAARAAHLNKKAATASSAPSALVSHANGAVVPADEPAVAAARAAHLSAKAGAAATAPGSGYGYSGSLNMITRLVDYPKGAKVPADEPAV